MADTAKPLLAAVMLLAGCCEASGGYGQSIVCTDFQGREIYRARQVMVIGNHETFTVWRKDADFPDKVSGVCVVRYASAQEKETGA